MIITKPKSFQDRQHVLSETLLPGCSLAQVRERTLPQSSHLALPHLLMSYFRAQFKSQLLTSPELSRDLPHQMSSKFTMKTQR